MKSKMGIIGAGAAAALVALGSLAGIAAAQIPTNQTPPAQTPPTSTEPRPVRLMGQVQSVGTDDLQLRTQRGNVDVNVSDRTWILVEQSGRCVEGELSDIQANQPASVA